MARRNLLPTLLTLLAAPAAAQEIVRPAADDSRAPASPASAPEGELERVLEQLEQLERRIRALDERLADSAEADAAEADAAGSADRCALALRLHRAARSLEGLARRLEGPLEPQGQAVEASARSLQVRASERARAWIEGATQFQDPRERAESIDAVRRALAGGDDLEVLAGLSALAALGEVEYDKASFRELVLPFVRAEDALLRVRALYALWNTAPADEDLALVVELAREPAPIVLDSITHLLALYAKGSIEGEVADVVLGLLDTDDRDAQRELLRGLWGARVSPEVASRLIELARAGDEKLRKDAIYFGLSTLQDKNADVIEELVRSLADPRNQRRALWGLGHGVPSAHRRQVADALVQLHEARSSASLRDECARIIQRYGDDSHTSRLK